ncbi:MAG: Jag N-terminal domain-containing protein [Desulfosarcina sp.]|nr:Jag N-terminal domain-containing protein [Desulfosarcina sp.]
MSNYLEFKGKNVDKALENASDALNIPPEKIRHEVLTFGSTGIFGLVGVKKAKIKVFVDEDKTKKNRSNSTDTKPLVTPGPKAPKVDVTVESAEPSKHDEIIIAFGIMALQKIVDGITAGTTVNIVRKREKLLFTVSGGDSGVLIGKRGQTLEAIQYLLEKMINKKSTNRVRVLVDVEGYLEKRKNNLKQMASRMAEKARRIKKPVTIGQMNAHDRRIVHIHLKDQSEVRTQSIGDGYYRKLMIFPKKQGESKRRNTNEKA